MQLKQYLEIFFKNIWILIVTIIIICLGTYIFTVNQPQKYTGSTTVYANIIGNPENSQFYNYDSYYSLMSSQILPDLIMSWLKDPANITQIYENANQTMPDVDIKKYAKLITTKKYPPSSVQITYESTDKNQAQAIINSTKTLIEEKTEQLNEKKLINNLYLNISDPLIVENKIALIDNLLIAFAISLIFGTALIYFINYMHNDKK